MYTLVVYPPSLNEPSGSPFSVKAMCLLNMAGITATTKPGDPRKTPNAKLPVLRIDDRVIPDSEGIRNYVEAKHKIDFDAGLNAQQRAASHALIRMAEEHLYFALVTECWLNDANWEHTKVAFFGHLPKLLFGFVTRMVRKQAIGQVTAQGMARHTENARLQRCQKDVAAIKATLGNQPFLFGDKPTAADATVVPMLSGIVNIPTPTRYNSWWHWKPI